MENRDIITIPNDNKGLDAPRSAAQVLDQVRLIQDVMKSVMREGEHFGKVPGCGDKPALLKPGAEKLSLTFRLTPKFQIDVTNLPGGHKEWQLICSIYSASGQFMGEGVGAASTMEGKYRFRKGERMCPKCGQNTIIKGNDEFGGGWLCYGKKGGCGAKFVDGDQDIEDQNIGRIEHDNPADYYNTCLKMAKKRAHVDAILTVTAASDIFTQDIDELAPEPEKGNGHKTVYSAPNTSVFPEKLTDDFVLPDGRKIGDLPQNELRNLCNGYAKGSRELNILYAYGKEKFPSTPSGQPA